MHVPTLEDFTAECLTFLDANAKRRTDDRGFVWGDGSDRIDLFHGVDEPDVDAELGRAKHWRAALYDAGLGWITGPRRYGGRELPAAYERLYKTLEGQYEIPNETFFAIGLGMVTSAILLHGRDVIKNRYLPRLHRGEIVGCQLFSEPSAGSDLASMRTTAVRDDDGWVVNGQKIWTSLAHHSDIGEIICRTDPKQPRHAGLTAFIVDMHAPGVDVRPLRQMTGGASFNDVYFTDVRVPEDHRLGDVGAGWSVAMTTLLNERAGSPSRLASALDRISLPWLSETLRRFGRADDRVLRDEMMDIYIRTEVARYTTMRAEERTSAGLQPGPERSIGKLSTTQVLYEAGEFLARVLGPRIAADTGEWGTYAWSGLVLGVPGLRLGAGTDEIQRNILAERVLGLPKESAPEKISPPGHIDRAGRGHTEEVAP